jgi:hypothetical protein
MFNDIDVFSQHYTWLGAQQLDEYSELDSLVAGLIMSDLFDGPYTRLPLIRETNAPFPWE